MRTIAVVERRVTRRQASREARVAFSRTGQPPASDFLRTLRIAKVDRHPDLIVERVARFEIAHACRQVRELTVDEPEVVHATRVRPRRVEK